MDRTELAEFEEFVRGRSTPLLRTAFLLTGDRGHAEDLLQSVLERVARRWRSIDGSPEAYARRALANAAVNRWRRRRVPEVALGDVEHASPKDEHAAIDVRDQLVRGLMELPPRMRAVLVLRYFDDLSEAETAEVLSCSVGTVKSTCSRGLVRLRDLVDEPVVSGGSSR